MATTLARKLLVTEGRSWRALEAPDGVLDSLDPAQGGVPDRPDVVILFVRSQDELRAHLSAALALASSDDVVFWIAYPKKRKGVATDIHRDDGWRTVHDAGFGPVAQVAIDEVWSALRYRSERLIARKPNSAAAPGAAKRARAKASK
jgi:hypothetical protein